MKSFYACAKVQIEIFIRFKDMKVISMLFLMKLSILCSCQEHRIDNMDNRFTTIKQVQRNILCRSLEEVKSDRILNQEYKLTDSVMSSEGVEWKGVLFSHANEKILLAETNWVDTNIISRVTIFYDGIYYDSLISVNSSFDILKKYIDTNNLNDSPDGYLILKDLNDKTISYIMNIDEYPELYYGVKNVGSIPDELRIQRIVLHCYE